MSSVIYLLPRNETEMTASRDEASFGYGIDAPESYLTDFYALVGDNFYTKSSSASDVDAYYIITSPGTNYTIVTIDNQTVGNTSVSLYSSSGNFLLSSIDYGTSSGITFTATSSKYIIALSSQFSGVYLARVDNNSIIEQNAI